MTKLNFMFYSFSPKMTERAHKLISTVFMEVRAGGRLQGSKSFCNTLYRPLLAIKRTYDETEVDSFSRSSHSVFFNKTNVLNIANPCVMSDESRYL